MRIQLMLQFLKMAQQLPHILKPNSLLSPNKSKPFKAKKISISILVMSLPILYVSLLHVPPNTLFHDTTFWFLISNSIIIIVATDSGVFAPSTDVHDIYYEYVMHHRARSACIMPEPPAVAVGSGEESSDNKDNAQEPVALSNDTESNAQEPLGDTRSEKKSLALSSGGKERSKDRRPTRSRSELAVRNHVAEYKQAPLLRSVTENGCMEVTEYAKMSNEELNRRVEEFIRKFKEIRLKEMLKE